MSILKCVVLFVLAVLPISPQCHAQSGSARGKVGVTVQKKYNSLKGVRVGDYVWTAAYEWGRVMEIDDGGACPVHVDFTGIEIRFTLDGRKHDNEWFPSLFFAPWSGTHGATPYPKRQCSSRRMVLKYNIQDKEYTK